MNLDIRCGHLIFCSILSLGYPCCFPTKDSSLIDLVSADLQIKKKKISSIDLDIHNSKGFCSELVKINIISSTEGFSAVRCKVIVLNCKRN